MTELWSGDKVAEYFGVSVSRARAILSKHHIERVTGYPADAVQAIQRPGQGSRTDLKAGNAMFDALDIETREQFQFRSLDTLVRRYRGHSYQIRQDDGAFNPPRRHVQILRRNPKAGGWDILAVISVPSEAVTAD